MIDQKLIAQIRAALEAATPEPWYRHERDLNYIYSGQKIVGLTQSDRTSSTLNDAILICLLRNHMPALLDEIERLRKENDLQHSQLLNHAQNVLPDRDATIERLRVRVAELEEKLRTQEYFDKNYTVIDDIGPLPKCFRCRHQQSMAFRGADAPCYHCRIADGYPKFEEAAE